MRKKKSKSRLKVVLGWLFYSSILCVALAAGTLYGWARRSPLLEQIIEHPNILNQDPRETFDKDTITLLVLGCDEDRFYRGTYANGQNIYNKYARSDMMLLTKLDFANQRITALSIPRDTECTLRGRGTHKINAYHELAHVYHWGDPNTYTKEAVESLLPGVKVDRVVVLDFDAFEKLINSVGGVDVTVPKAMNYDDDAGELHIHLKPGAQHLDGYNAMCFVRFRHDAESDFGRQQRQKELLMSFKQAALKNIFKLPELAEQGKLVLNGAMTDDEILALASFSRKVKPDQIKMGMVPVVETGRNAIKVDRSRLPATLAEYGFVSSTAGLSARR
jgi:LCP family protein required for cell wall assembly